MLKSTLPLNDTPVLLSFFNFEFFLDKVSCSPDLSITHYIIESDFELLIFLHDYRHIPLCFVHANIAIGNKNNRKH